MSGPPALIVLEGPEGVGKTTQVRLLAERLDRAGVPHLVVREPGGTSVGNAIRDLVLEPRWPVDPRTEALLFMASRAQLVQQVIRPAMTMGTSVIADRFFLSTYAYQVAGHGLPEAEIRSANRLATGDLVPHLTLLLDVPPGEGMRRAAARGRSDRIERLGGDFHRRVAAAFAESATPAWQARRPECGPIVRVDGNGSETEVADRIAATISARLGRTLGPLAGSHL
jgi:dTMP kinase